MGDIPNSRGVDLIDVAWEIIKITADHSELPDESCAQIILQLNRHLILKNCIQGWKLLTLFMCWYRPSEDLSSFVDTFLRMYTVEEYEKVNPVIEGMSSRCLELIHNAPTELLAEGETLELTREQVEMQMKRVEESCTKERDKET
ncbi:putative unconventional myosin-XVB-like [Planoprotostelium fungivorum]|uniref:Putative unconventional myosin-XVB-like n=1 Tax=Planoprotostelium fungivorum TaxID=1890364 RepID=A0A2P6NLR5_9EUKA|nr:putative unconventional myosin-XVB-like [Planoprotostelium fungivorum]